MLLIIRIKSLRKNNIKKTKILSYYFFLIEKINFFLSPKSLKSYFFTLKVSIPFCYSLANLSSVGAPFNSLDEDTVTVLWSQTQQIDACHPDLMRTNVFVVASLSCLWLENRSSLMVTQIWSRIDEKHDKFSLSIVDIIKSLRLWTLLVFI